ncbi:MoaD/ThiS family protein [Porticoccaceae bacterium]|nr:MoaD/ThiS family protein [Porticoccaceae bacterium]
MITLLFFGRLGDFAGDVTPQIEATEGLTPALVRESLAADYPALAAELSQPQVLVSLDQRIARWDQVISDGAELAFLPPVTGG